MTRTTIEGASRQFVDSPPHTPTSIGDATLALARQLLDTYDAIFRVLCERGVRIVYPRLQVGDEATDPISSAVPLGPPTREKFAVARWLEREQHLARRLAAVDARVRRTSPQLPPTRALTVRAKLADARRRALHRAELDRRVIDRFLDELEADASRVEDTSPDWARAGARRQVEARYGAPWPQLVAALHDLESLRRRVRRHRAAIVGQNRPLVELVARRFSGRGVLDEDLSQEGALGLMRAVDKFDPTRGYRFSTYAQWWIRQSVARAVQDQGRVVRLPVHINETLGRLRRAERELAHQLGRQPEHDELARELDVTGTELDELQQRLQRETSLQKPIGADANGEIGDLLADETAEQGSEFTVQRALEHHLGQALQRLDGRSRFVIEARHGLRGEVPLTLSDIGQRLGVTRERVRQIEHRALDRLRRSAYGQHLDEFV